MRKLFTILIASSLLFACNKEENSVNPLNNAGNEDIIVFESQDEYYEAVRQSLEQTPEERKVWEKSHGIVSLGTASDELYLSTDFDQFGSLEEIKNYVDANADYLELIEDENGEFTVETKNHAMAERYVINKNCMYQVKEKVYKVYENGTAMTSVDQIQELQELDELAVKNLPSSYAIKYVEDIVDQNSLKALGICTYKYAKEAKSGNNKLRFELKIKFSHRGDSTYVWTYTAATPYKRSAYIWFRCYRTISYKTNVKYSCADSRGYEKRSVTSSAPEDVPYYSKYTSHTHGNTPHILLTNGYTAKKLSYGYIYAWASTAQAGRITISCEGNPYFN